MVRSYFMLAVLMALPVAPVNAEQRPLWELGLGIAPVYSPDYRGSDQSRAYFLPLPYVVYNGEIIRIDRRGLYSRLIETDRVNLDLSFDGGVPVDSSKNDARRGMADLDPVFETGLSLEICVWNHCSSDRVVQLRLPVRAMFSTDFSTIESRGGTAQPNLNLDIKNFGPGGNWRFSASLGPLYATERYHDYYYQVTAADATPVRPVYDARAGYSGSRFMLTVSKRHRRLWFGGFARYDDLSGSVFEDSPLVRVHHSFMAGFGVAWIMAESKELVEMRD